ncbi:unnamed protein product [Onchocerca flexuosa]|uniref:Uncharacterized protein n=1 Tax=Onchocerca flexuosa TaxID=387005 RepID=A0A183HW15_9BILA|nr:unnamed protein product [Onchocerca flexuosa]
MLMDVNSAKYIESEQCLKKTIELASINYSYGIIDVFYNTAQKMCRKMQVGKIREFKDLNKIFEKKQVNYQ